MRLLVTGSNGLVGSRLCRQLAQSGHTVLGVGRGPRRVEGDFDYCTVELTDRDQVFTAAEGFKPEAVVNPASMTEVDACEKAPQEAFAANVSAPAYLGQVCRKLDAHLVHVSTDYVFDGDRGPYSEEDLPNPRGVYAITKHMGEEAVKVFAGSFAIARTAVVYGWPVAGRPNFGAWVVQALQKGQPVKLFEDQFTSPSLADSVAQMLAELAVQRHVGIWNTTGADIVDRVTFGKAVCEEFGFDPALLVPTRIKEMKLASPRPIHSGLKVDKVTQHLRAQPLKLAEALKRFHAAFTQGS